MIEYKNILYCTDYSEDADIALLHAVDFAKRYGAKIHVLHVLLSPHRYMPSDTPEGSPEGSYKPAGPEIIDEVTALIREKYKDRLAEVEDLEYVVRPGVPFVEIVRYARENDVDLIVLGVAGNAELGGDGYGSTVENVSKRAHCHVMSVRNPAKAYTL